MRAARYGSLIAAKLLADLLDLELDRALGVDPLRARCAG